MRPVKVLDPAVDDPCISEQERKGQGFFWSQETLERGLENKVKSEEKERKHTRAGEGVRNGSPVLSKGQGRNHRHRD